VRTVPGEPARAWLWLANPAYIAQEVRIKAQGPAPYHWSMDGKGDQATPFLVAGSGPAPNDVTVALSPRSARVVGLVHPAPPVSTLSYELGVGAATSRWTMAANAVEPGVAVSHHASLALWNPFIGVVAYHEIGGRGQTAPVNFRVRALTPARLEIRRAATMEILAVDASGDGAYLGAGDILAMDGNHDGLADIPGGGPQSLLLRAFPLAGQTYGPHLDLVVEVLTDSGWEPVGHDRILGLTAP
jgi:hypothetical protein